MKEKTVVQRWILANGPEPFDFELITQCALCYRLTDSRLTPGGRNTTFRVCRVCAKEMNGFIEMEKTL